MGRHRKYHSQEELNAGKRESKAKCRMQRLGLGWRALQIEVSSEAKLEADMLKGEWLDKHAGAGSKSPLTSTQIFYMGLMEARRRLETGELVDPSSFSKKEYL